MGTKYLIFIAILWNFANAEPITNPNNNYNSAKSSSAEQWKLKRSLFSSPPVYFQQQSSKPLATVFSPVFPIGIYSNPIQQQILSSFNPSSPLDYSSSSAHITQADSYSLPIQQQKPERTFGIPADLTPPANNYQPSQSAFNNNIYNLPSEPIPTPSRPNQYYDPPPSQAPSVASVIYDALSVAPTRPSQNYGYPSEAPTSSRPSQTYGPPNEESQSQTQGYNYENTNAWTPITSTVEPTQEYRVVPQEWKKLQEVTWTTVKEAYDYEMARRKQGYSDNQVSITSTEAPKETYEPPKETYGPPKETYGPPKQEYGPPKQEQGYGPPKQEYGPPKETYGPPKETYGPPKETYGPPKETYRPPKETYGPPKQEYGPPKQEQGYGPPKQEYGPPSKDQGYSSGGYSSNGQGYSGGGYSSKGQGYSSHEYTEYTPAAPYGTVEPPAPKKEIRFLIHKPGEEEIVKETVIEDSKKSGEQVSFIRGPWIELDHKQKIWLPPPKKTVVYILLKEPQIKTTVQVNEPKPSEMPKPEVFIVYENSEGVIRKHYDLSPEESHKVASLLGDKIRYERDSLVTHMISMSMNSNSTTTIKPLPQAVKEPEQVKKT